MLFELDQHVDDKKANLIDHDIIEACGKVG